MKKWNEIISNYGKKTNKKDLYGNDIKIGDVVKVVKKCCTEYIIILNVNQYLPEAYYTGEVDYDHRLTALSYPKLCRVEYIKIATAMKKPDLVYQCTNLGELLKTFMRNH